MNTHERGRLDIRVSDDTGQPIKEPVVILLNQNAAQFGHAFRLESHSGGEVSGEFPHGAYILQALAKGYDVGREFIEIHPHRAQSAALQLKKGAVRPRPPVTERLRNRYGIAVSQTSLQNLTVKRGQLVSLDYRRFPDSAHVQVLHPQSLKELKRWVGSPEDAFVGHHPRFGRLPSIEGVGGRRTTLSQAHQDSLNAVAREYIYGNARAVPAKDLDILQNQFERVSRIFVPIFFYLDVVIEDGATLKIGDGSSVFFCNTLTIYPLGILTAIGDVRADIGTLQQL